MFQNLIITGIVLFVAACGSSRPLFQPTEKEAARISTGKKKIMLEDLKEGYKLYVANCAGCHSLHVPSSKLETEWEIILPKMFSKTQLTKHQQQLITDYIHSKL